MKPTGPGGNGSWTPGGSPRTSSSPQIVFGNPGTRRRPAEPKHEEEPSGPVSLRTRLLHGHRLRRGEETRSGTAGASPPTLSAPAGGLRSRLLHRGTAQGALTPGNLFYVSLPSFVPI